MPQNLQQHLGLADLSYSTPLECNLTETVPFCQLVIRRNVTFFKNLEQFHGLRLVLCYLIRQSGRNELRELSGIL